MIEPMRAQVLVKLDRRPDTKELGDSGVVLDLPHQAQRYTWKGTVLASGPGVWVRKTFHPNHIQEGDRVIVGPYNGLRQEWAEDDDGCEVWLCDADPFKDIPDIYGVIEDE